MESTTVDVETEQPRPEANVTSGQTPATEAFGIEESTDQTDETVYPTGLKLWLSMASVLMVALAKGLVPCLLQSRPSSD